MQIPHHCTLCPRACGADRAAGQRGFCGADNTLRVARAALHHWEEPCLSGDPNAETGSGTVFFSGCTLKCCYCQNYPISQGEVGKAISVERLTEIFMNLQNGGAKNVNLVTASQYLPWVAAALDAARAQGFFLPVVYNTGGYETVDAVRALARYVDIWLADYKYADGALAAELSAARDYPAVADAALRQMLLQTGAPVYDADGYLQKGVIVRHLALPGHVADSKAVLRRLAALLNFNLCNIRGKKECGPNGSKQVFLNVGKVFLRALARDLGLHDVTVSSNAGGIGVSGDCNLIGMWENGGLYVSISQPACGSGKVLLYRTVRHSRGYKGGYNHFITRHELEKWSYAHLLDALCALRKDREFDEQAA